MSTRRVFATIPLGAVVFACCAQNSDAPGESGDNQTVAAHLYEAPGVTVWPNGQVPICFDGRQTSTEALWMKQVLSEVGNPTKDTWSAVATIDFTFFDTCPPAGKTSWVRIEWNHVTIWRYPTRSLAGLTTGGYGFGGEKVITFDYCDDATNCLGSNLPDYQEAFRDNAAHELGHVLGFVHEQQRPDYTVLDCDWDNGTDGNNATVNGGTYLSILDKESIMNYCRRSIPVPNDLDELLKDQIGYHGADAISAGDTIGAQTAYPPARFAFWLTPAAQIALR